jgi:hypothetical protein
MVKGLKPMDTMIKHRSPVDTALDFDLLHEFEQGLDPLEPESSTIPCRILGYGEISTVFEIQVEACRGYAFKRMSVFETEPELDKYLQIYIEYNRLLEEEIPIRLPRHGYACLPGSGGRPIFYIIQEKVASNSIGSQAIHLLSYDDSLQLFQLVLRELNKLWAYNSREDSIQIAIDGQISNWAISGFDFDQPGISKDSSLLYLDTSTPLFQINGVEQLDPELFLRSGPSFMAWIIRRFFLDDVMTRYYDPRKIIVDLIGNLYKEGKPDLIPELITTANDFFTSEAELSDLEPILESEIQAYYREDSVIWTLYAAMRRMDRFLHQYILRKDYPYILPGKVNR